LGDLINRFKLFIGIEFVVEVNEICSSASLVTVQTVSSEVSYLPAFEIGVVGHTTGGSSSGHVRSKLAMSLALSTPVSIRGAGTI